MAKSLEFDDAPRRLEFDDQKPPSTSIGGNVIAGALRGAGSIGATLLSPLDMLDDSVFGQGAKSRNQMRREQIDEWLRAMGASPDSIPYQAGKLGAEVAGTAGVGTGLANAATALAQRFPALIPYLPKAAAALESGGFRVGQPSSFATDLAARTAAGAAVGGASAGLVDPSQAGSGSMIGAAIPGGVKAAGMLGSGIRDAAGATVQKVAGLTTGAGGESFRTAYQAGKSGAQSFVDAMRGKSGMDEVVGAAKDGIKQMRNDMHAAYANAKGGWGSDTTQLNFAPVVQAYNDAVSKFSFKGVQRPGTQEVKDQVESKIAEWAENAKIDPAFMTVAGLDELKQQLASIVPKDVQNRQGRALVSDVVDSVKKSIIQQRPEYAAAMKDYWQRSTQLDEIERALSLGEKASVDTALRKLQSLTRNNVYTNYGNRVSLARELEAQGGAEIMNPVAGQALNSWTPRGLQAATTIGASAMNPAAIAAAPLTMPRLMGEVFYGAGRASGGVGRLGDMIRNTALFNQAGQALPDFTPAMTVAPAIAYSR